MAALLCGFFCGLATANNWRHNFAALVHVTSLTRTKLTNNGVLQTVKPHSPLVAFFEMDNR